MQGYLIAETDELGKIEWLWVYEKSHRAPKALDRSTFKLAEIDGFEIHGAPKGAIIDWLQSRENSQSM